MQPLCIIRFWMSSCCQPQSLHQILANDIVVASTINDKLANFATDFALRFVHVIYCPVARIEVLSIRTVLVSIQRLSCGASLAVLSSWNDDSCCFWVERRAVNSDFFFSSSANYSSSRFLAFSLCRCSSMSSWTLSHHCLSSKYLDEDQDVISFRVHLYGKE